MKENIRTAYYELALQIRATNWDSISTVDLRNMEILKNNNIKSKKELVQWPWLEAASSLEQLSSFMNQEETSISIVDELFELTMKIFDEIVGYHDFYHAIYCSLKSKKKWFALINMQSTFEDTAILILRRVGIGCIGWKGKIRIKILGLIHENIFSHWMSQTEPDQDQIMSKLDRTLRKTTDILGYFNI